MNRWRDYARHRRVHPRVLERLLIPDDAFCRGLSRLERLVARGPIRVVLRYVMLWGHR